MNLFDLVVIGSGPGGYIAAIRAAQLGFKTAIIEKYSTLGGTCLNVGCIPSKALLDSSEHYYRAQHTFNIHGIEFSKINVHLNQMMARKNDIISSTTTGINFLMEKNKISIFNGVASFINSTTLEVNDLKQKKIIKSKYFIIATGSKPKKHPAIKIDKDRIITSTEALNLKTIPKHLIIIGGGVIGLEIGSIYLRLGSKVSIIESSKKIVASMDNSISKELIKILKKQGITFFLSHQIKEVNRTNNIINVTLYDSNKNIIFLNSDYLLIAIGRSPYTKGLNLKNIGINLDEKGYIKVNQNLQTNIPNIYAIGDVIGGLMLAHKAEEEGILVAEILAGQKPHIKYDLIPIVIYTWPEVAAIGKTEEQLKLTGNKYKIGNFNMRALGRARASMDIDGFVKVLADAKTDEILGIHLIAARGADLISECVIAMEYRASAEDIARISHAHPTFSEAIKEAALDATEKRSLHQ